MHILYIAKYSSTATSVLFVWHTELWRNRSMTIGAYIYLLFTVNMTVGENKKQVIGETEWQ